MESLAFEVKQMHRSKQGSRRYGGGGFGGKDFRQSRGGGGGGEGEGEGTTIITTEEGVEEGAGPATGGTEVCDHTPWRLRT